MRILALCPYVPYPPTHGGRIRSGIMLRALASLEGAELEVAAPAEPVSPGSAAPNSPLPGTQLASDLGIRVHELPPARTATSPAQKLHRWLRGRSDVAWRRWSPAALHAAHAAITTSQPDVVLIDGSFAAPLLPDRYPGTVVLGLHNVESEVVARLGAGSLTSRIEAHWLRGLERRTATRAALTIAVSDRDADQVRALAPGAQVVVVENSVDLDALPLLPRATPAAAPRLLFVGSFDYPPNFAAALEILDTHAPAMRAAWPAATFRLVGKDPTGEIARRAAATPGVECVGFVPDLLDEYRAATAVYIPLRSGGGTRIKVLEAMALGRPVIATRLAVEGLGCEPTRDYLTCETPADGVASARTAHAQDASIDALVARGRTRVETRFSHTVAAAGYRAAFARI